MDLFPGHTPRALVPVLVEGCHPAVAELLHVRGEGLVPLVPPGRDYPDYRGGGGQREPETGQQHLHHTSVTSSRGPVDLEVQSDEV